MRPARFHRVIELYVGQFGAADDVLLCLGRERVPFGEIVQVLLHDDIAAADEGGVLAADQYGIDRFLTGRVFGPIHEPQEVAAVEIAKAVHLVDRRDRVSEPLHDLCRQFETEIHAFGPDME